MIVTTTAIEGVLVLSGEPVSDERGSFVRVWDAAVLEAAGADPSVAQCGIARNTRRGTLRGLHLQRAPHAETKLVRCVRGAIFDVAADLRPDSPTFRSWFGAELSADHERMLLVPPGCAHGYLTLADASDVAYVISAPFDGAASDGVRYDDPDLAIAWPFPPSLVSPRDLALPWLGSS